MLSDILIIVLVAALVVLLSIALAGTVILHRRSAAEHKRTAAPSLEFTHVSD